MKTVLALLISMMFLTACEFQQDPLKGAPDAVREGRLPEAKPVAEKAFPRDAMVLDAPPRVNGRVDFLMEVNIKGRLMLDGETFKIYIDNIAEFPGATFDEATGVFKWTPKKDVMGGALAVDLPLKITMAMNPSAKYPKSAVEKTTVILIVQNTYSKPIVNSMTGPSKGAVGEYSTRFEAIFEDLDAGGVGDLTLNARDCSAWDSNSIAHLVDFGTPTLRNDGKYRADVYLKLYSTKAALLPTGTYCFGIVAVSKYGVVSDVYQKEIAIEGQFKGTLMTVSQASLNVGEKTHITFSIYDQSGNGYVSIQSMDDITKILPGSSLTCKNGIYEYLVNCEAWIDATAAEAKNYEIKIVSNNSNINRSRVVTTKHYLNIEVKKAATP